MYISLTMGPTVSPAVAVGRAVWMSASISSNAAPGHENGETAQIAGGPSVSEGVDSPPVLATFFRESIAARRSYGMERSVVIRAMQSTLSSGAYYNYILV